MRKGGELLFVGQLSKDKEEAGLEEGRFGCKLLNGISSVLQLSPQPVNIANRGHSLKGVLIPWIIKSQRVALLIPNFLQFLSREGVGMPCLLKSNVRGVVSTIISDKQMIIREQTGV